MLFTRLMPALLACSFSIVCHAEDRLPEELVVSGFRPVAAVETDISLSLLNEQTLRLATLAHAEELVQLVPNMNFSGEGSRPRYLQLRGVGEREQYEGAPNPSVGFIVDDIDLSSLGAVATTFDITQVDVLRGPQSARYGASALAGLVYMQSAPPEQDFSARAELTRGSQDSLATGLALGGGLTDALSARISVYRYRDDGFRTNAWLGRDDTNQRDELTTRLKLGWQASERWDVLLTGLYADFDNGYDAFALDNSDITFSDEPGQDAQKTRALSLRLTGRLNSAMDLVAITTLADSKVDFSYDGDWVNEEYWLPIVSDYRYSNPRDRTTAGQEVRLVSRPEGRLLGGSTDWVIGLHAHRLRELNRIDSSGEYIETAVGCDPGVCITDRQISSRFEAATWAVFASTNTELGNDFTLSAGLRLETRDARYDDAWADNGVFVGMDPVTANNRFRPSDTLVGGHLALAYEPSATTRVYARIARGFKAGGFNPSRAALGALPAAADTGPVEYRPEYLWNYELGLSRQWPDAGVTLDLSTFYMDRRSAQLSQSAQIDPIDPNTFVFVTANGAASVYGAEAELRWQPMANWQVDATLGLLESEIDEWSVRPAAEGRSLAHAPSYDANIGVTWTSSAGWFARLDVNAVAGFYFDISHDSKSDAYQTVNLRLGREWEHWSLTLWGRNLLDERFSTRGFFFGNEPPAFEPRLYTRFGQPRQIGLTLSYQY